MKDICYKCKGLGATLVPVCCNRPTYSGECCGDPEPSPEPCEECFGTGQIEIHFSVDSPEFLRET